MLKAGMVVRDRQGRTVMLMGRNACDHQYWWGHRLKPNGQPDTNTMPTLAASDVLAVRKKDGSWRMILPGLLR